MIDLDAYQLAIVLGILDALAPRCEARAYGSRATWTAKDYSDLDLALLGPEPLPPATLWALREAFEESELNIRVDVADWRALSDGFRRAIAGDCVVIRQPAGVKSDWQRTTVGDFAPFTYGKGLRAGERQPSGAYPVFGSNGIVGYHDRPLTDGPTVIIGRKGTVGVVHYSPGPCWPIDTTYYSAGNDAELMRYQYYALAALGLDNMNSHSAVPGLNRDDAHALELRIPGEAEQRRIAQILGALDDRIALHRRMNATLDAMCRALFQAWFVDFEPVRAKMSGIWRRGATLPGLPTELWARFPSALADTELGPAPAGWAVGTVGDELAELVSGQRPRGGAVKEGIPSIGAENVIGIGEYDFSREKYIPPDFFARVQKRGADVRNGDVLLYKDGAQIGRKTYFDGDFPHRRCAVNEHVFILRLRNRQAQRYLYFWLDQHCITQEIVALNSNSAQPGINQAGVRSLPLLLPPADVIAAFDATVAPLTERIFANSRGACALAALRDTLLPRLVAGELPVAPGH